MTDGNAADQPTRPLPAPMPSMDVLQVDPERLHSKLIGAVTSKFRQIVVASREAAFYTAAPQRHAIRVAIDT